MNEDTELTMNADTRVAVCCYAGDAHQINFHAMVHHRCPVTVLSPEDAPVTLEGIKSWPAGIEARHGGKRAYIGQDSLDRQRRHLEMLLEYPENHFLIHDSDSVALDPKIPDYLYAEPNVVWSNQVEDGIPEHQGEFPPGWAHIALQPPYFLSRKTIEAMLAVAPQIKASPVMPFIDFYMVQLTMTAGLPWRRFMDCISCPITGDPLKRYEPHIAETYERNFAMVRTSVLHGGANILHSIKDPAAVTDLLEARRCYLAGHSNPAPRVSRPPRVGGGRRRNTFSGPGKA